jgi:hypothetical protein
MNHEGLSEANLNVGTVAKLRSPKVNPDFVKLNFTHLANWTGATKILGERSRNQELKKFIDFLC